jgi:HAMP domain-containing protein
MYALPVVSVLLAGTLFAASRTVNRDTEKLQRWMRESAEGEAAQPQPEKVPT